MNTPLKKVFTATNKEKTMQLNGAIFSQTVAILQQREISLRKLFAHELHSFPPAISDYGALYLTGAKSSLIHQLVTPCHNAPDDLAEYDSTATMIMDGGRIPYQHAPKTGSTFKEYADNLFKILEHFFIYFKRIDIVFDIYLEKSLKSATREKRGNGIRKKVSA